MIQRIPLNPDNKLTDIRISKIFITSDYTMYALVYSEGVYRLYVINLRTYCNMGLVEEFEEAIMERIKEGRNKGETLSRHIELTAPVLVYPQE